MARNLRDCRSDFPAAVNAPIAPPFHIAGHWRRAIEQRYSCRALLSTAFLLLAAGQLWAAAQPLSSKGCATSHLRPRLTVRRGLTRQVSSTYAAHSWLL